MATALGFLVIGGVIAAIYLSLALAGIIGAATAGLAIRSSDPQHAGRSRWVGIAAATGVVTGQAVAFVAFVGAALFDWSLAGFVLPPVCWSAAAVSAAVVRVASSHRPPPGNTRDGAADLAAPPFGHSEAG